MTTTLPPIVGTLFQYNVWPRYGSLTIEAPSYVVSYPVDPNDISVAFNGGEAHFYSLGPQDISAKGTISLGAWGAATFLTKVYSGFRDFAIYAIPNSPTISDPVVHGLVLDGLATATTDTWSRGHVSFIPPKVGMYIVPEVDLGSVPNGGSALVDAHQMEVRDAASVTATPVTDFVTARSMEITALATRVNYCENPNGRGSNSVWGGTSYDASTDLFTADNSVTPTSLTIDSLVSGEQYTISATLSAPLPVTFQASSTDLPTQVSNDGRTWATFTAVNDTMVVTFSSDSNGYAIKDVMVNHGNILYPYFDGNSGRDYLWEADGSPESTRSYFYPGRTNRNGVLIRNLQENIPAGLDLNEVKYAVAPHLGPEQ